MGHNVGTAAANAVKRSERVKSSERANEQILKDIRGNIAAKLFVTPTDQKWLLEQYDAAATMIGAQHTLILEKLQIISTQDDTITSLQAQIEQFRSVYEQENRSTSVKVERVPDSTVSASDAAILQEIGGEA